MRGNVLVGVAVAAVLVAGGAPSAQAQSKRKAVAVMDFDYGTIDHWWGQSDIGKGMADQVVDALVNDGTFRVIERKKLDTVLAEQDFAHSDRADVSAAHDRVDHQVLDGAAGRRAARPRDRPRGWWRQGAGELDRTDGRHFDG